MRRIWRATAIWLALPWGILPAAAGLNRALLAGDASMQSLLNEPAYFPLPLRANSIRERNAAETIRTVSYPGDPAASGMIREPQGPIAPQGMVAQPTAAGTFRAGSPSGTAQENPQVAMTPRRLNQQPQQFPQQPYIPPQNHQPQGMTPTYAAPHPVNALPAPANSVPQMAVPLMTVGPDGTQYMLVPVPTQTQPPMAANSLPTGQAQGQLAARPSLHEPARPALHFPPPVAQYGTETRGPVTPRREVAFDLKPITEQVNQITRQGFRLAERNALFAAKDQFIQALRLGAQGLDSRDGGDRHLRDLNSALTALEEAEDFAPKNGTLVETLNVSELVAGHRTPVLQQYSTQGLSSMEALQHYYQYAQQQLVAATGELRGSADAYFGLGKVHSALTQEAGPLNQLHAARAIVFQQTAYAINPEHDKAANELGVLLARHGQWQEAKKALLQSVRVQARPETWHNLAVVHQRMGEHDLAQRAQWEQQRLAGGGVPAAANGGVQWVDAPQFARLQPGPQGPAPTNTSQAPQAATANLPRLPFWPSTPQRR